jgi:hypothetical protein
MATNNDPKIDPMPPTPVPINEPATSEVTSSAWFGHRLQPWSIDTSRVMNAFSKAGQKVSEAFATFKNYFSTPTPEAPRLPPQREPSPPIAAPQRSKRSSCLFTPLLTKGW